MVIMAPCAKTVSSIPVLSLSPSTRSCKFPFQLPSAVFSRRTTTPTGSFSSIGLGLSVDRSHLVSAASASNFVPNSAELLDDVRIFTAAGEPVLFKDLWDQNEGIAVVALLRHFGCICCWELASALKESKVKFDSAGVKLIAIGVGTPDKARILAERLPFPMECLYADPDRKAYDILGLYYGLGRTFFNPASAKVFSRIDSLRKAGQNYTIQATPDDRSSVLQQVVFSFFLEN
uniref:Uncharacterized protein n=1 Tax=Rhizophora mucronata TaxID=61149 RepID=A0A2P2JE17_RHIMU